MKKIFTTFIAAFLVSITMWGQDTIRSLVISEVRWDGWQGCYAELTNMGTEAVDLSEFIYGNARSGTDWVREGDRINLHPDEVLEGDFKFQKLSGILEPGESFVATIVYDEMDIGGTPRHPAKLAMIADMKHHSNEGILDEGRYYPYNPEIEQWGFDSISPDMSTWLNHRTSESGALFWTSGDELGDTIVVLVDQFALELEWSNDVGNRIGGYITIAGVEEAVEEYNFVRRYNVTEGETDWLKAVGSTPGSSQWLLIPHGAPTGMIPTTVGNHGDYTISVTSDDATIGEGTISVPWGTQKGDSITNILTLGDGMAWDYYEHGDFIDSLATICTDGDTLLLFACGVDLIVEKYVISIEAAPNTMADVFPRRTIDLPGEDDTPGTLRSVGGVDYIVKEYESIMDSIISVPFATKVDTFFNRLDKAPNADWEIVFAEGTSNEVSTGDILRVTAEDGTTVKDYYIRTDDYGMSANVDLAAILWPDVPIDEAYAEWKGDTIPGFISTGTSYKITLAEGTSNVPALVAVPEDLNANISIQRATSLSGGISERTTSIMIVSEEGLDTVNIKILFDVLGPTPQKYSGEPMFSKFLYKSFTYISAMEIVNPTDDTLDLSNYMIMKDDGTSWADAVMARATLDSATWAGRYLKYVPGYKWPDKEAWLLDSAKLLVDNKVDPILPPGDVFGIQRPHNTSSKAGSDEILGARTDIMLSDITRFDGNYANPWNEFLDKEKTVAWTRFPASGATKSNYYLLKIMNPNVRNGTKNVYDPDDYMLVDAFGSPNDAPWILSDGPCEFTGKKGNFLTRLPNVFSGVNALGDGLLGWRLDEALANNQFPPLAEKFGQHELDPVTGHISIVSSLVYLVDKGYEGDLKIDGVSNSETVQAFYDNLIKADPEQDLKVLSSAAADTLELTDAVAEGDTLQVTSANGVNMTKYIISVVPLSDNAVLTAVDGSGLEINAAVTDTTGTVGGFQFGATVREVYDNVNIPAFAIVNVIDSRDHLVPFQRLNEFGDPVDLIATGDYRFEVIAQNGKTIVYDLLPDADALILLSDIYEVIEEPAKSVNNVLGGTAVGTFLSNVYAAGDATMKVLKISGQERMIGNVSIDDVIELKSADGSETAIYEITFEGEMAAYVTSTVFTVSQEDLSIEVDEGTSVESLLAGLTPALDAQVEIQDVDGNAKSTGDVLATDVVVVTSGDGINVVTYEIDLLISVYNDITDRLKVYPNPATEVLYVENIPADTRVRISDISGRTHLLTPASDIADGIDLGGMKSGMYFIVIEKENKALATLKFIKN